MMGADFPKRLPRQAAHGLIRAYQLTLSGLIGRHCRHLPSCSDYADEAIQRGFLVEMDQQGGFRHALIR